MSVYGILGWPVAHSRSPAMQEAAFRACGVDARYVRFPVRPEALGDAVRGLRALGIAGANVTVPHKEAVGAHLDAVDAFARRLGAVNTIVREGDRLEGRNTDAPGLVRSLEEAGLQLDGKRALVLGAGGAARAAVAGLEDAGATVRVAARRPAQAERLLVDLESDGQALAMDALEAAFAETDLLVQATSATMGEHAEAFAAQLPWDALKEAAAAVDLVYTPRETTVLREAARRGHPTVDGLGMLVHQGALAFEAWTGHPAPLAAMRAALL